MKKASAYKSCLKASINKAKYIFIIYCAYSVLSIAIGVLLSLSQVNEKFFSLNMFLANLFEISKNIDILAIALALFSVIWLFGKYTNPVSNNLIKSMPAKDKHFFWSDFTVGLVAFIVPIALSIGIQTFLGNVIEDYQGNQVFETVGVSFDFILNYIFAYCVAVFCISFSSGILEASITFVIVNFVPSIIASFIAFAKSSVLGLFPVDEFANKLEIKTSFDVILSSVTKAETPSYSDILKVTALVLIISAALATIAFFIFVKLRAADNSTSKIKKIISGVSLCAISFYCGFLILFFKRTDINLFNALVIIPTMVAASFIIFYLANTVKFKSLHISFKKFIPYFPSLFLVLLIGTLYFTGGYGAATYLPKADAIKSVSFNYTNYNYVRSVRSALNSRFTGGKILAQHDYDIQFPVVYDDQENINNVLEYHRNLLDEYISHGLIETVVQPSSSFPGVDPIAEITYTLKSGKKIKRYYNYKGNEDVLSIVASLPIFEKSVLQKESRALDYIDRQPVDEVEHIVYISDIFSNDRFVKFTINDHQLKELVDAIYQDEKDLDSKKILSSEGNDTFYINIQPNSEDYLKLTKQSFKQFNIGTISPNRQSHNSYDQENDRTEDEPYFNGVFNSDDTGVKFAVKHFYHKTIKLLNDLIATSEEPVQTENKDEIKQAIFGKWDYSSISYMRYVNQRMDNSFFKHDYENVLYQYNYYSTDRFYNPKALNEDDRGNVDGKLITEQAFDYLISNLKVHASIDYQNPGFIVFFNTQIELPNDGFDPIIIQGRRLYYITANEYNKFVSLCQ